MDVEAAVTTREKGDFCIEIQFRRGSRDPGRVFRAMAHLIKVFEELDQDLASSIRVNVQSCLLLEEIEAGSIRTWLRNQLTSIDDSDLRDLNWKRVVGGFLVRAKHKMIEYLGDRKTISTRSELQPLEDQLQALAQDTNVLYIPAYAPVPARRILAFFENTSAALAILDEEDVASYISDNFVTKINRSFGISPETSEEILTRRTLTSKSEMILKVKKPDYLGTSMWELRHENHVIRAKIVDHDWLQEFQRRKINVRPGDSLRALVEIKVLYDDHDEVVNTHYTILRIIEVHELPTFQQTSLLPNEKQGSGRGGEV
jgi:hypothetical protein